MMPRMILNFVLLIGAISSASGETYSVSIITQPSQGPFRIDQSVQFSCVIEPKPPDPVKYRWRNVDSVYDVRGSISQNISVTYYYQSSLRFCWYFCEVLVNRTLIGSASKLIEIHGVLYTNDSVVRSFNRGETLQLSVNISDSIDYVTQFIASLAWYHNGTRIISGNKFTITDNETILSISNMAESDAGIYEVKINSVTYNSRSSPRCDLAILPLLEYTAVHAPVVFTVQEHSLPEYNPDSVISTRYFTENCNAYTIMQKVPLNVLQLNGSVSTCWLFNLSNSRYIYDGNIYNSSVAIQEGILTSYSLQIMYHNTEDIIGNYVGMLKLHIASYLYQIQCQEYYIAQILFRFHPDPYFTPHVSYWSIKLSSDIQCNARDTGVYNGSSVPSSCSSQLAVVVGVVCSLCFFIGGVLVGVLAILVYYKCYKKEVQIPAAAAPPPPVSPVYEEIDHEDRVQPQGRNKTFELQENMAYGHAQK